MLFVVGRCCFRGLFCWSLLVGWLVGFYYYLVSIRFSVGRFFFLTNEKTPRWSVVQRKYIAVGRKYIAVDLVYRLIISNLQYFNIVKNVICWSVGLLVANRRLIQRKNTKTSIHVFYFKMNKTQI